MDKNLFLFISAMGLICFLVGLFEDHQEAKDEILPFLAGRTSSHASVWGGGICCVVFLIGYFCFGFLKHIF